MVTVKEAQRNGRDNGIVWEQQSPLFAGTSGRLIVEIIDTGNTHYVEPLPVLMSGSWLRRVEWSPSKPSIPALVMNNIVQMKGKTLKRRAHGRWEVSPKSAKKKMGKQKRRAVSPTWGSN